MNARQLIEHLSTLDPESEIMVDAPMEHMEGQEGNPLHAVLPVRCVQRGKFPETGLPFAIIAGCGLWRENQPVETYDNV